MPHNSTIRKRKQQSRKLKNDDPLTTTSNTTKDTKQAATPSTTTTTNTTATTTTTTTTTTEMESLWKTFTSHPLVRVAPLIVIPFLCYQLYIRLSLQQQSPAFFFRPSVTITQDRQLLIVGTWGSGLQTTTWHLASQFSNNGNSLELGWQISDAQWSFVRDGTVSSSLHLLRFLDPSQTMSPNRWERMAQLCIQGMAQKQTDKTKAKYSFGFHPKYHRSNVTCSRWASWDRCWARECMQLLDKEWGCALTTKAEPVPGIDNLQSVQKRRTCQTPFRTVLHQVLHPLRTVESLVSQFCVGGLQGDVHTSFHHFVAPFLQSLQPSDSCLEHMTKYVLEVTLALLEARRQNIIHGFYRAETTSPCDVVKMAGFTDPDRIPVYPPHLETISNICQQPFHEAHSLLSPPPSTTTSSNEDSDTDRIQLTWNDLRGGMHRSNRTDNHLMEALMGLTVELGYTISSSDSSFDVKNEF